MTSGGRLKNLLKISPDSARLWSLLFIAPENALDIRTATKKAHLSMKQKNKPIRPAALFSLKNKFFFVPVGKVANSSIKFALQFLEAGAHESAIDRAYWR